MPKIFLLFVVFTLSGCSLNPKVDDYKLSDDKAAFKQRSLMVGKWFGDSPTTDAGRKMQIVERFLDGTMKIRFRVVDGSGNIIEQTELAQWGLSGRIYFSISRGILNEEEFQPFDPKQPYYNDAYEVIELTEEQFRYRHVSTDNEYTIKRVPDSFDFP